MAVYLKQIFIVKLFFFCIHLYNFLFSTYTSHTFEPSEVQREQLLRAARHSEHALGRDGQVQEKLSRGAFRLGKGDLFNLIYPFGLPLYLTSAPLSSHPFIPASSPPHLLLPAPRGRALRCFHKHAHTRADWAETPPGGPWAAALQLRTKGVSSFNPRVLTKSGRKSGDWWRRIWTERLQEVRPRIPQLSHATYATLEMTSPRPQTFHTATAIKCD